MDFQDPWVGGLFSIGGSFPVVLTVPSPDFSTFSIEATAPTLRLVSPFHPVRHLALRVRGATVEPALGTITVLGRVPRGAPGSGGPPSHA